MSRPGFFNHKPPNIRPLRRVRLRRLWLTMVRVVRETMSCLPPLRERYPKAYPSVGRRRKANKTGRLPLEKSPYAEDFDYLRYIVSPGWMHSTSVLSFSTHTVRAEGLWRMRSSAEMARLFTACRYR